MSALVLPRNQPRFRVRDRASARQRERQIAVGEARDDRRRVGSAWLSGANREPNGAEQLLPEPASGWMRRTPLLDNGPNLDIRAWIIRNKAAPSPDGATKAGSEI